MALEASVAYSAPQDQFGSWGSYDYFLNPFGEVTDQNLDFDHQQIGVHLMNGGISHNWDYNNSSPEDGTTAVVAAADPGGRRKRRRTKTGKNKEELENQRMTHIAVERNRRKQMNDYLAVIRSLMPASYVQRGDQASIITGAINFVKELEYQLQILEIQKRAILQQPPQHNQQKSSNFCNESLALSVQPPPFRDFFTFPQYSATTCSNELTTENIHQSRALADIEVTMVESHANLKILSKKRPKQLLKIVAGLQCLWLTILHVNVTTTADQLVLYTFNVKLEDGCQMTTVDEIADAVNRILGRIEEEAILN